MLTEETIKAADVTVKEDGTLECRDVTRILRDGEPDPSFAPRYHRYVYHPGADLSDAPEKVKALAETLWTEEVIEARKRAEAQ